MKISIALVLMKNIAIVSSLIKTSGCCEGQYCSDAIIILPVFSPLWLIIALSGLIVMYICFSSLLYFHFLCYLLLCWSLTWYNQVIPFFGATMFYSIRGSSYFRLAFIGISQFSPILYMSHWASTGVAFRSSQYSLLFDFGVHYVEVGWLYYSRQSSFSDFSAIWRGYFSYISR